MGKLSFVEKSDKKIRALIRQGLIDSRAAGYFALETPEVLQERNLFVSQISQELMTALNNRVYCDPKKTLLDLQALKRVVINKATVWMQEKHRAMIAEHEAVIKKKEEEHKQSLLEKRKEEEKFELEWQQRRALEEQKKEQKARDEELARMQAQIKEAEARTRAAQASAAAAKANADASFALQQFQ